MGSFSKMSIILLLGKSTGSKEQRKTQNLDYLVAINLILSRILDPCHDAFIQTNTMHNIKTRL